MIQRPLGIFIVCCLVPLILAYTAIKLDWLPEHTTNHGQFLKSELRIPSWQPTGAPLWTIAINAPNSCETPCKNQLQALQNLYVALGKHQKDVALAVLNRAPNKALLANYQSYNLEAQLPPASLYLIDHTGLVVLQYQYFAEQEKNRAEQKGLLSDLKKLLKYARSS
ncbi:transmembrane cytochrome oxidase associated protein [Pseudoalteromonas sp. JBTF-M23]|uniref:Transmembrane cytochrome oxidase associated protein n=1 Tax=Pseudoalteromonas caenipelagi TaxID=2726988 RepID=A0A849VHJ8_9GAMM|nr:transmembrane cytochrome oxidase associated protein [Pseudoalteromonas caenipelagi]NOU52756.1 transmembrane cytochrome oxidase associated protein [Pseudoalteromonas caenipelagi]